MSILINSRARIDVFPYVSKMNVTLRKARNDDKEDVIWVESRSTPNLSYVSHVWDMFLNDEDGEWTVEELNARARLWVEDS